MLGRGDLLHPSLFTPFSRPQFRVRNAPRALCSLFYFDNCDTNTRKIFKSRIRDGGVGQIRACEPLIRSRPHNTITHITHDACFWMNKSVCLQPMETGAENAAMISALMSSSSLRTVLTTATCFLREALSSTP